MKSCGAMSVCVRAEVPRQACFPWSAALAQALLHFSISSHVISWHFICHFFAILRYLKTFMFIILTYTCTHLWIVLYFPKGKDKPVALLGASTGTTSLQVLHVLPKSEIFLIRSHWESIWVINLIEGYKFKFNSLLLVKWQEVLW